MMVQASTIIPHSTTIPPTHAIKKKDFPPFAFTLGKREMTQKNEGLSRVWKEKQVRKNTRLPRGRVFSGDQSSSAAYFNCFI